MFRINLTFIILLDVMGTCKKILILFQERTVISFLKNMSIEYKAGTLVIYIEVFSLITYDLPQLDIIWRVGILSFVL